jgi:hypothetical protein
MIEILYTLYYFHRFRFIGDDALVKSRDLIQSDIKNLKSQTKEQYQSCYFKDFVLNINNNTSRKYNNLRGLR